MLASITPLGERSRGFSWPLTASAFVLAASAAGTAVGAAFGALGALTGIGAGTRAAALAAVALAAAAFDAPPLRSALPSTRRQVDEDWLGRYRGWVYGAAFGAQLGAGVVTIVTSAAVYAAFAAALLCATAPAGAAVGATFGLARGLALLPARRVRSVDELHSLHRRLAAGEPRVRRALPVLELALAVAVLAVS